MKDLDIYYQSALSHRKNHECGAVPYANGSLLTALVAMTGAKRILEIGTGIGYSSACLALGNAESCIETIDQDAGHIALAKEEWKALHIEHQISIYVDKAEAVLPNLQKLYDVIFFDGYTPSLKFLNYFEKYLAPGSLLVTANLFLSDPNGGKYLSHLQNVREWKTVIASDTAISQRS